jgi:hypothetical protein
MYDIEGLEPASSEAKSIIKQMYSATHSSSAFLKSTFRTAPSSSSCSRQRNDATSSGFHRPRFATLDTSSGAASGSTTSGSFQKAMSGTGSAAACESSEPHRATPRSQMGTPNAAPSLGSIDMLKFALRSRGRRFVTATRQAAFRWGFRGCAPPPGVSAGRRAISRSAPQAVRIHAWST